MKISTILRPSGPLAVCAPVSGAHVRVVTDVPQLPWAHQVQVQAELARTLATNDGSYGTNGFRGSKGIESAKRMTEDARGVPPRGRPV